MKKESFVLVCVTGQKSRTVLINAGAELAKQKKSGLRVLSVFPKGSCFEPDFEALKELEKCARENNAEMTVFYDDRPFIVAAALARKLNVSNIVTGFAKDAVSPFITGLHALLPDVQISMVDDDGRIFNIIPSVIEQKI